MDVQPPGLNPNRLYSIANTYQVAGATIVGSPDFSGYITDGPARILFYQAVELYLKAYLLLSLAASDQPIMLSPDLKALLDHAVAAGLTISDTTEKFVRSAARDRDYEKVRYDMDGAVSTTSLKFLIRAVIEVRSELRAKLIAAGIEPGE
jgi:hypothetical protein